MSKQNTITFNGRVYNAETGEPISGHKEATHPGHVIKPSAHQPAHSHAPATHAPKPKTTSHHKPRTEHHPHDAHRKAQHSKTLMRHSVKKPVVIDKAKRISDLKTQAPVSHNIESNDNLINILGHKFHRAQHAESVHKSHLVQRFADQPDGTPTVVKKVAHVPVKHPPHDEVIKEHSSAPLTEPSTTDLFSSVLAQATSHQQTTPHHSRRHRTAKKLGVNVSSVHFGMGVLIFMVLSGFILYQNANSIGVKLAGAQAGINAKMPSYVPDGFTLNKHLHTAAGSLSLHFKSTSDKRIFTVNEVALSPDSNTVLSESVFGQDQPYQSMYLPDGTKVYVYGSSASWVKNDIWYSIVGDSQLSSIQLLNIASSL